MFSLRRFGIKLGLDIIDGMLEGLGHPEKSYSCIHVAGTNGKGSIASALAAILHAAGHRVGLYTSPHLVRFNERICINNTQISDRGVIEAYEAVKAVAPKDREPTFFEYSTAMALYAFAKAGVNWAVIETGMGGRLDATNILSPELCIISNVSLEHRLYLGNTVAQIAAEKGGIIKPNIPTVTGVHQKSAIEMIENIAAEKKAPLFRRGSDFRVRRKNGTDGNFKFTYHGLDNKWADLHSSLRGIHQLDNAALVLAGCEVLMRKGVSLSFEDIKPGLENVRWPGRLEILETRPEILIDGAHNLIAARRLAAFLSDYGRNRKVTLVIGILDDKPYKAMLKSLVPLCDHIIATRPVIERSLPASTLAGIAMEMTDQVEVIDDVSSAVVRAMEVTPETGIICIAGSLYVAGEAIAALEGMSVPVAV
ncbi:MAG: bifunctional folylpolyglutamate synthase/dihydrofolate synthase [Desulfobacteraceae bacterium]|nr:bifunctional folylpolyglutamate synthase/dihydrofolate synthase [Desulfobacteraceae bacterium]MCF8093802.1 bifunctional folylpolyglutamate synthase/dihydrofolate synthase [Desulfobacteraceae bacterium]